LNVVRIARHYSSFFTIIYDISGTQVEHLGGLAPRPPLKVKNENITINRNRNINRNGNGV